jgi:hypothetical protein
VAKSVCRASGWHSTPRVSGPHAGLWRGTPAANSFFLSGVLQRGSHAPGAEQGCAPGSGGAAVRYHCCHPDLVRAAPPLRPDIIFGKDTRHTNFCAVLLRENWRNESTRTAGHKLIFTAASFTPFAGVSAFRKIQSKAYSSRGVSNDCRTRSISGGARLGLQ